MDTLPNELLCLLRDLLPTPAIGRFSRTCKHLWDICNPVLNKFFDQRFGAALSHIDNAFTVRDYMAVTKLGQKYCDTTGFGFWDAHRLSLVDCLRARPDYFYIKHNKVWNKRLFGDPDK